ncbi:putative uncharacterized protein [Parachlamydia acanthamoebae UV-7]|uniref:Uncharacterized protein n=2 Tax=Parachlamydia acanthamoebae TaxID=83552 RepID=F8L0K3_PARAV|nr:hypothetical protein [Parachlamydia acanthamoebae]EFB41456.1 hypothetical protein pah_c032o010 [Parachlamydia acanthamoebae str. Hall's coccus]KIA77555.1 hypothetical protein DB43_GE00360 [Parachlamydia acanthamoebae]CCB86751.1 putative uncharacterized protein [Parachlamydia acanthamoebae UV-7]
MTSYKQIVSNQRNALKSTGPRTETGKALIAQNALKHGVFSKQIVLEEESEKWSFMLSFNRRGFSNNYFGKEH